MVAAIKVTEIGPGVCTPVRSKGTPCGSVRVNVVVIVPSWAIEAEVMQAGFRLVDRRTSVNPWWDHLILVAVAR